MSASGSIATRSKSSEPAQAAAAPVEEGQQQVLTGPEKAAVILLILGEAYAKDVWRSLEEDELRIISRAMAGLGTIEAETVERLMVEFIAKMSNSGAVTGSFDRTENLLAKMLPGDRVNTIMEEIRGPAGRNMWQKLSNIDSAVLANFLKNEYPQTIAVVMSRIASTQAAQVLGRMPDDLALEVVQRMLKLDSVQKETVAYIEECLRTEFMSTLSNVRSREPHEVMAEIFNGFDRQTEARFLSALDISAKDSAKRIRALMFTFEDLGKLDSGAIQTLLRAVDKDTLARALKGANADMKEMIFSSMSARASKNLQDDMQSLGPLRLKEVDEAQTKMVAIAKDLADKGEIVVSKGSNEDELVY